MTTLDHIAMLAIITCVATLFTLRRVMCFKLIFGYAAVFDVSFTVIMLMVFSGTVSGAASATLAGLLLGVFLTLGRLIHGYRTITVQRAGWRLSVDYRDHPGLVEKWGKSVHDRVERSVVPMIDARAKKRAYCERAANMRTLYGN